MDNFDERRLFVQDKLWYDSDIVLSKSSDNKRFADLAKQAMSNLDLSSLDKDRLCVEVANSLKTHGAEERDVALFLVILERSINILEAIEKEREELIELLEHEIELEQSDKNPDDIDEDYIQYVRGQIATLKSGKCADMANVVREYSPNSLEQAEKAKSRFDGELVRILLDYHKGNRRFTKKFRGQLATLLGVSARSVTSMKAWRSGELNGSASTLNEILNKCGASLQTCEPDKKEGADAEISDKPLKEIAAIDELYSSINSEYLSFIQSLQPDNLSCDENCFTREQRKWIYALMIHGAQNDTEKKKIRIFLADKIFKCSRHKVSAVTAYLAPTFRQKAKERKSELWEDIQSVERKGVIEVVSDSTLDDKNPDYNNPNKENGWRKPEARMIEKAWGSNQPLRGKRIFLLEAPQLLEWQMLEKMGAEEQFLTVVERERELAMDMESKLPKARVVHDTVEQFFQSRIPNNQQITTNNPPKDYNEFRITCRNYPQLKQLLTKRKFRMPIRRPLLTGIGKIEGGEFDLISLDVKNQFETMRGALKTMFALGLLGPDSLLFTNFVAQREQEDKQTTYNDSLLARLFAGFSRASDPNMDSELKDRRAKAITEAIRTMAQEGGVSELMETLISRELRGGLSIEMLFTAVIEFNQKANRATSQFKEVGDFESLIYFLMAEESQLDQTFNNNAFQLLIRKEIIKSAAKRFDWIMKNVRLNRFDDSKFVELFFKSGRTDKNFPEVIRDLIWMLTLSADNRAFGILDHESVSYRDSTLMHSDFLWLQDVFKVTGLTKKSAASLKGNLLGTSRPKPKDKTKFKSNVLASLGPYFEFFLQDDTAGSIQRAITQHIPQGRS